MKYGVLIRLLSYTLLFAMIALGGFGMLLPAIFAIESPIIWIVLPVSFAVIIIGIAFCCDRLLKIVKGIV